MTDGKKPRWRKKIPKLRELDDMSEGEIGQPSTSGKDKPARPKTNRRHIRVRKGVGRNREVAKAPRVEPKPQPTSKPDKAKTADTQPVGKDFGSRAPAFKGRKIPSRSPAKSPEPEVVKPSKKLTPDQKAQNLARQESEEKGHQLEPFEWQPDAGDRNKTYKSRCVKCKWRATAKVVYEEGYSNRVYNIMAYGKATKETCPFSISNRVVGLRKEM